MLPEIYGAEEVAREIVAERNRQIARRQLMAELPPATTRSSLVLRRLATMLGGHLVTVGEHLRRYGQTPSAGEPWMGQRYAEDAKA